MQQGYLVIQTRADRPGLVRLLGMDQLPAAPSAATHEAGVPELRYAASFGDIEAALMHAHSGLRRGLVDVEAGLYRCDPLEAVAIADAIDLKHRVAYLDPDLAGVPGLADETARLRMRHLRADRVWKGIGIAAILLLVLKLLMGL